MNNTHKPRVLGIAWLTLSMVIAASGAAAGEAPVNLGSAANFAVLAGSTVTNVPSGSTIVTGDLGVSPGTAVTGFPPGTVVGTLHAGDPTAAQAQVDLTTAYNDAAGRTTAPATVAGNLGGLTLAPGLYKSTSSLAISSGDLTLDAQGDPNGVFIFQMASTLTVTSGRQVILAGGAKASNVFWQVGTSATLGTTSVFQGNILADTSITMQTGGTLNGRALARSGAVTLASNRIIAGEATSGFLCLTPFGDIWSSELSPDTGLLTTPDRLRGLGFKHDQATHFQTLTTDVTGDGYADLACITPSGELWTSSNDGARNFGDPAFKSNGWLFDEAAGWGVFAADVNGDAKSDLVQITPSGEAWTSLTIGTAVGSPSQVTALGFEFKPLQSWWIGTGDVNGDGRDDLIQSTPYGDAWAALGNVNGTFQPAYRLGPTGYVYSRAGELGVLAADFNGDGRADLAAISPAADVWVALSNGSLLGPATNWGPTGFYDAPERGWTVYAANLNGDGKADLLVMVQQTGEVWKVVSTGSGFGASTKVGVVPGFRNHPAGPYRSWFVPIHPN